MLSRVRIAEMFTAANSPRHIAILIGPVTGILLLFSAITHSALIFSGPLAPFAVQGIGLLLFGCFAFSLIIALTSSFKGAVAFPQSEPAIVLATIGASIVGPVAESGRDLFATMLVIIILSSLLTGVVFLFIGWYRVADFLRFVPYPVVGGFLAGVGWFMLTLSFPIVTGIELDWDTLPGFFDPSTIWKWAPGADYGVLLFIAVKFRPNYLLLPLSIVAMTSLYHLGLFSLGFSLEEAKDAGQLFSVTSGGHIWPAFSLEDLSTRVDWGLVAMQVPAILLVIVVSLFTMLVEVNSLEISTRTELDLNQ